MQPPKLTYDKSELVIRKKAWINLILGFPAISLFAIALFFHKETRPFFTQHPFVTVAAVVIILAALYFLVRNSLDQRIKMVINNNGIWLFGKGLLAWDKIQFYYFEQVKGEGADTSLLKFKLLDKDKEIKVDVSFFNTSEQDVETAIRQNSGDHKIIGLKESY